jgi:outer membrane autotransporter protein
MLNPFLHNRAEGAGGPALAFAPERSPLPRDAAAAYAAFLKAPAAPADTFNRRWSIWGSAYGGTSKSDGDPTIGSHDTRTNAYGFAAGLDHRLSPNTLVGFALAGGGTHWSLAGNFGTGRSDMFQAGVYGSHRFAGSAYVSAALAYTWHDASTTRDITLPGLGQLRADFHAQSFGARGEGGYRFATPVVGITPYGAVQVLSVRTPDYTETGSPGAAAFALSYNSRTVTATRSELGLWFDRAFWTAPDAALTLRSRIAWAHDFNTDRQIAATFQTLPLASFTVTGASPAEDFALVSAAAELRLRNGWSFAAKGDAELAGRTQTYSGTGVLRYAW